VVCEVAAPGMQSKQVFLAQQLLLLLLLPLQVLA
jgi:hypothetical protein